MGARRRRVLRRLHAGAPRLEVYEPGESEDLGVDWLDPRSLEEFGEREATEPWTWAGPARSVTGRTWGGCIEVVQRILTAGRFPADPSVLEAVDAVLVARPPISDFHTRPDPARRAELRAEQRDRDRGGRP